MDKTQEQRLQDMRSAIAQQELEGLTLSDAALRDMDAVARGTMTLAEALANVAKRG